MKKGLPSQLFLVALSGLVSVGAVKPRKSSKIPDRREFPVSSKVNPCTDFYEYACSGVIDSFQLRPDRSRHIFAFNDSSERLLEKKKLYLADLLTQKRKLEGREKDLADNYRACMDPGGSRADEHAIVKKTMAEISAIKTNSEFAKWAGERLNSGEFSGFDFGAVANQDKPEYEDFLILAEMKSLPERSYYSNKAVVKDFEQLVAYFFKTLKFKDAAARARRVVAFETEFAKTFPLPAEMRELYSSRRYIEKSKFSKRHPNLVIGPAFSRIPDETLVRDLTPENFSWVDQQFAKGDLETLKDVYLWHALSGTMDDAYPAFFKKSFAFNKKHLGGPSKRSPRDERCAQMVISKFGKELDSVLIDRLFPDFPTEKFIKLAENVRSEIIRGIQRNDWLDAAGKRGAIEKIKTAKLQLVKPQTEAEWDFNPAAKYLPSARHSNAVALNKALTNRMYERIGKPRNRDRWSMSPLTVNAYYSPSDNKFVMPLGILQYPFYDPAAPDHVNLGAVGAVIGHELGHGIDDKGSKYDSVGRLKQWMTARDLEEFKKRTAGLVAQFDRIGHNGKLTLGENIGDLVGLTFGFHTAFGRDNNGVPVSGSDTAKSEVIPPRTAKKEFFTQYARVWCGVVRPKMAELLLKTDPHSAIKARVNEQVKHQPGFQEAFQCKESDKMVLKPEQRISVW